MEIAGKVSVILFKTFFDANTAREFLQNNSNFKETEKNNFIARWYKLDDESLVSESLRKKITKYTNKFLEQHLKKMNLMGSMGKSFNNMSSGNNSMNSSGNNFNTSGSSFNNSGNNLMQYKGGLSNNNNNTSPQLNNGYNSQPQNKKMEEQSSNQNGKFTCRFEIQIENDKDFQVARRLIGSKVNISLTKGMQHEKDRRNVQCQPRRQRSEWRRQVTFKRQRLRLQGRTVQQR